MMDIIDDSAAKILLAMDDGDSINRLSKKIDQSYSWTHDWVRKLVDIGIVERDSDGIRVADLEAREAFEHVAQVAIQYGIDRDEAYVVPHFAGMPFAFTRIDAAYVWTHGGYQVARDYTDYPVFLAVDADDVDSWRDFLAACGLDAAVEERTGSGLYYVLFPVDSVTYEWVDGSPVIPLVDAISWMQQYRANFQPALEIVAEEYGDRPAVQNALDEGVVPA